MTFRFALNWTNFLSFLAMAIMVINPSSAKELAGQPLTVKTKDSVILQSEIYPADNAKSSKKIVLLLHMLKRNRQDYAPLIPMLTARGFEVVSIDFRGHGQSTKKTDGTAVNCEQFDNSDWAKLPGDIEQFVDQIVEKNGQNTKVYIIGASIGANTAALVSAKKPSVQAVVLLSPGLDYRGLAPEAGLKQFKGPVLIIASADDEYSYQSSQTLQLIDNRRINLIKLKDAGHGTKMFANDSSVTNTIAGWLDKKADIK